MADDDAFERARRLQKRREELKESDLTEEDDSGTGHEPEDADEGPGTTEPDEAQDAQITDQESEESPEPDPSSAEPSAEPASKPTGTPEEEDPEELTLTELAGVSAEETMTVDVEADADYEEMTSVESQYVSFSVQDQTLAISIFQVKEVLQMKDLTTVFKTPDFVVGAMNVRGDIMAILDLGLFLGMGATDPDSTEKIVIAEYDGLDAGFIVDSMIGVQEIEDDQIEEPPPTTRGVSGEWLTGVLTRDRAPIMLLDMEAIFTSDRIADL